MRPVAPVFACLLLAACFEIRPDPVGNEETGGKPSDDDGRPDEAGEDGGTGGSTSDADPGSSGDDSGGSSGDEGGEGGDGDAGPEPDLPPVNPLFEDCAMSCLVMCNHVGHGTTTVWDDCLYECMQIEEIIDFHLDCANAAHIFGACVEWYELLDCFEEPPEIIGSQCEEQWYEVEAECQGLGT